jgi:hypothetical protein
VGPYLSEYLIESVMRRVRMPISQATLETWEILSIADEQMRGYIVPIAIGLVEDYLIAPEYDVAIQAAQSTYRPPDRAMKLREVAFLDAAGHVRDIPRVLREDLEGADTGFYLDGANVVLIMPEQCPGWSLRMTYHLRPSQIVPSANVGVVSSLVRATGVVTLAASISALTGATKVDLLHGKPPFDVLAQDVTCTVATTTVTISPASAIPASWGSAGDFVCLSQQAPGPQLHPDIFPWLAQAIAVEILDGNSDDTGFQRAAAKLKELEKHARSLLDNRVPGEPNIIGGGINYLWDRRWNYRRWV